MFAVEAGFTLSTLYKMDKIRDVRDQIGNQGKFGAEIVQTYDCYCYFDARLIPQIISTKHSLNYFSLSCLHLLDQT